MTASSDIATLRVAGENFAGWQTVEITRSIENAASSFGFTASARYPGQLNPARIKPGQACEILIGADKVITGWIDSVTPKIDAKSHHITIAGRSKTADLVDCAANAEKGQARRWHNRKMELIAADLAKFYDCEVVAIADTGEALARHAIEKGETVFECIDRMARLRSLLVCDDAEGRLTLLRAGSARAGVALEHGVNVLSGDSKADFSHVFSSYIVKGQRTGDDEDFGDVVAQITGEAGDPACTRRRVLIVNAEGHTSPALAKKRALWEAATRLGKSLEASITVQGWRQTPGGKLWTPNLIAAVKSEPLALDGDFLIAEVTYRLSDQGTTCDLKIGPPDAWKPEPIKTGSRGGSGLWKEIAKGVKVAPKAAP